MDFQPEIPTIHSQDSEELGRLIREVKPEEAGFEDIEDVLCLVGKFTTAGYGMPAELRTWLDNVPTARLYMVRVIMEAVISNATHIHHKRVHQAMFGLVGYLWTTEPARQPKE